MTSVIVGRGLELRATMEGAIKFKEPFKNFISKAKSSPK